MSRSRPVCRRVSWKRLLCESLENRELLTVTASLAGSQLNIMLAGGDTAFVKFEGDQYKISSPTHNSITVNGGPATGSNTHSIFVTGSSSAAESVVFQGGDDFDLSSSLKVDSRVENVTIDRAMTAASVDIRANSIIDVHKALTASAGAVTLYTGSAGQVIVVAPVAASADINIFSGGDLALKATLDASGDDVRLVAEGNLSQTQIITAANLSARATAGNIALNMANIVTSTFAGSVSGSLWFNDAAPGTLNVGSIVAGPAGFAAVNGVKSGSYTLITTDGSLRINSAIVTAGTGDVNLRAAGTIVISASIIAVNADVRLIAGAGISGADVITTSNLSVITSSGVVNLSGNNQVKGSFAAKNLNGSILFKNARVGSFLTSGAVVGAGSFGGVAGVNAVGGDIMISLPSQGLTIHQPIQVAAAHAVRLQASGDITQTTAGRVIGGSLLVRSTGGQINLATDSGDATKLVDNVVAKLAAETTAAGKNIKFYTAGSLDISSVVGAGAVSGAVGVKTAAVSDAAGSGSISIRAQNAVKISQSVISGSVANTTGNAVSGAVRLQAGSDVTTVGNASVGTGNAQVSNVAGRTSAVGAIGIQTAGSVKNDVGGAFAVSMGAASGATTAAANKAGQLAVKASGTTQIANRTGNTIQIGSVAADTAVFTPGITGGTISLS